MAICESVKIVAHPNLYNGSVVRELRIDFSLPNIGTDMETGIAVLVPGFGANIDSNVYKKMRDTFSDDYNLIVMQCDYFGSKFMQKPSNYSYKESFYDALEKDELILLHNHQITLDEFLAKTEKIFHLTADLKEDYDEFNDMGYMQAIDIITAIEALKVILDDNNFVYNKNRVIGYGHSHGAYLLHLCNKMFAPFSYIIDNSGWIEPLYLQNERYVNLKVGKSILQVKFDYVAKKIITNKMNLNLFEIYKDYENNAQILTFQGTDDELVDYDEKKRLINSLKNTEIILVSESDVDNIKYRTNTHGLSADFLELFSYALSKENKDIMNSREKKKHLVIGDLEFFVDTSELLPLFNIV